MPDHTGGAHPTTSGRMVSVPVSGTGCTMHVRYDVGGGGRLQMEWNTCTYSYNLLERKQKCATSPLSHQALSSRSRHRRCQP